MLLLFCFNISYLCILFAYQATIKISTMCFENHLWSRYYYLMKKTIFFNFVESIGHWSEWQSHIIKDYFGVKKISTNEISNLSSDIISYMSVWGYIASEVYKFGSCDQLWDKWKLGHLNPLFWLSCINQSFATVSWSNVCLIRKT